MKKSRNTDDDFIDSVLDEPYFYEPTLQPIDDLERKDSGLTNRQMAQRRLVEKAAAGDMIAIKLLAKYIFQNTQNT